MPGEEDGPITVVLLHPNSPLCSSMNLALHCSSVETPDWNALTTTVIVKILGRGSRCINPWETVSVSENHVLFESPHELQAQPWDYRLSKSLHSSSLIFTQLPFATLRTWLILGTSHSIMWLLHLTWLGLSHRLHRHNCCVSKIPASFHLQTLDHSVRLRRVSRYTWAFAVPCSWFPNPFPAMVNKEHNMDWVFYMHWKGNVAGSFFNC